MKQLTSILLTVLLLLSSSGVTFAQHFCGEYKMMEEITLGEKHLSCGMVMDESSCGDEQHQDHDCCDNEYVSVTIDEDFSAGSSVLIDFQQEFVFACITTFVLNIWDEDTVTNPFYSNYYPPPLVKDIPVFYESFLI